MKTPHQTPLVPAVRQQQQQQRKRQLLHGHADIVLSIIGPM